ncbi:MAG: vitamin K epoxide reductase family protein [Pseudomonadota bacterium]
MKRYFFWLLLVAAAAGIAVSADLSYVHYKSLTDSSYQSFCAISEAWNCQVVAISKYSVFLRIPVSVWGFVIYLAYLFVAVVGLLDMKAKRAEGIRGLGASVLMAAAGLAVTGILFTVSAYVIQSKCILCVGLYIVNSAIFLGAVITVAVEKANPLKWLAVDVKGFLMSAGYPMWGAACICALAGMLVIFYPRLYGEDFDCAFPQGGGGRHEESHQTCNEEATYGTTEPVLVITEFSDYECPYCAATHFALRKVVDLYPDKVMMKHRHFPLDKACNPLVKKPFHRNACLAAKAAVCAGKQRSFWEYNDLLYRNQHKLSEEKIHELAGSLGLDTAEFGKCMNEKSTLEIIDNDIAEATNTPFVQSGMVGTPIMYIGDRPHIGGLTFNEARKMVEEQLTPNH